MDTGCIRTRTRITAEPVKIKIIRCSLPTIEEEEKKDIKPDKVYTKKETNQGWRVAGGTSVFSLVIYEKT